MVNSGEIGGFGGHSLEHPRQWLGAPWPVFAPESAEPARAVRRALRRRERRAGALPRGGHFEHAAARLALLSVLVPQLADLLADLIRVRVRVRVRVRLGLGLVADLLADRREVLVDHHAVELRDRLLHLVRVRGRVRGRGRVRVNQVELRDRLLHLLEGHIRLQARSHRVAGSII